MPASDLPKLYREFADWWPLLSPPWEYEEEAAFFTQLLREHSQRQPQTVLELGCGGGNNASHLKQNFEMTLVDLAPHMLDMSRKLNPECAHFQGDMRDIRLDQSFDAVFIHDAIVYMQSEKDLRLAIRTAFTHCEPGGVVTLAPDYVRETFHPGTTCGGHDGPDGRGMRYLEWVWDPDPKDTIYTVDYTYTFRDTNGTLQVETDRHIEGLFPREDWLAWLDSSGFDPQVVETPYAGEDLNTHEVFVGVKRP